MKPIAKSVAVYFSLFLLSLSSVATAQNAWLADMDAAKAKAKAENKDIIVAFTASGWVEMCSVFDRDILNQPAFVGAVSPNYVLVRYTFPDPKSEEARIPSPQLQKGRALRASYRVAAYPVLMIVDSDGKPFGMNGFQPLRPDEYAKVINAMKGTRKTRDTKLGLAASLTGVAKAQAIAEAIPELPGNLAALYYQPEMEALIAGDPQNSIGKTADFKKQILDLEYSRQMEKFATESRFVDMIRLTDKFIADQNLQGELKQKALFNKMGVQQSANNLEGAITTLLEIVEISPESAAGKRAQGLLDNLRTRKVTDALAK